MRRIVLALSLAVVAVLGLGIAAEAHALVRSSMPADGANLDRAPSQVSITFTERPETQLSTIQVFDAFGRQVQHGPAQAVANDPLTLVVPLPKLDDGVYTVSWRTVSAVDGHFAAGAFAFGVGASPAGVKSPVGTTQTTPPPAPIGVAGRWIYYVGLAFLLGGTWIAALVFRNHALSLLRLSGAGVVAATVGLAIAAESQREAAGANFREFVTTSLGSNFIIQLLPVLAAGVALVIAWRARARMAGVALSAAGALTLVGIFTHALASHAPSSQLPWLELPAQWVHLTAFTVWIGGLAALLVGIRRLAPGQAAQSIRRFSFVAGYALAAIGITGLLRAIDEVGAFTRLFTTLFGVLILVKVTLFVVLATLGAINRWWNVPAAEYNLTGLQRVARGEVGVAAVVIGVAAVLTALPPPSYSQVNAATPPASQVVASGHDFGTTVNVRLLIAPGYPGSNRFSVQVRDYDTGKPVSATRVSLRFDFPGRPQIGESTLPLKSSSAGSYDAQGTNLSLAGRWDVTVVVERGLNSAEIPLTVTTASPPETIRINRTPGLPTIYLIGLPGGRLLSAYVDPGHPGFNAVHATFEDSKQAELPMQDGVAISGTPPAGPTVDLPVTRLDPIGHFVGQNPLTTGRWRFDITATSTDGVTYHAYFQETIQP
jgi:copper transport protein